MKGDFVQREATDERYAKKRNGPSIDDLLSEEDEDIEGESLGSEDTSDSELEEENSYESEGINDDELEEEGEDVFSFEDEKELQKSRKQNPAKDKYINLISFVLQLEKKLLWKS